MRWSSVNVPGAREISGSPKGINSASPGCNPGLIESQDGHPGGVRQEFVPHLRRGRVSWSFSQGGALGFRCLAPPGQDFVSGNTPVSASYRPGIRGLARLAQTLPFTVSPTVGFPGEGARATGAPIAPPADPQFFLPDQTSPAAAKMAEQWRIRKN